MTRAALAIPKVPQGNVTHRAHEIELLIDRWRLQRIEVRRLLLQVLSGELLAVSGAEQAQGPRALSGAEQMQTLRTLCSELVDYIGTGHFKIYGRILPRSLRPDAELHALLQHIFHSIGQSTDAVLGFNDRYQHGNEALAGASFRQALTRLNRSLLLRFALEEQLLELVQ